MKGYKDFVRIGTLLPNVRLLDGEPMNPRNDSVIRVKQDELPPAQAFWSLTLYDLQNSFFIPNDRKNYSVGESAGKKLSAGGCIEIYIAAARPDGEPEDPS